MTIRSPRVALTLLLLVAFIWGAEFVLVDLAVSQLPTHTFNAIRFGVAAIALIPLLIYTGERVPLAQLPKLLGASALLGLLLFAAFYTQTEGLRFTTVSNAGFITGLNVPLVPALAFLLFRQRSRVNTWIGVALATLGLYLLTVGDSMSFNRGDTLVLACAFAFAAHIILTGRFVGTLPVTLLSILQLLAVALYSTIAASFSPDPAFYHPEASPLSWQQQITSPIILWAIGVVALLGTAYAFWAQSACQTLLSPDKVALVFATEPVFAHISAWLFLDEHLGTQGLLGAALIIAAMLITELGDKKHPTRIEPLDHTATPE